MLHSFRYETSHEVGELPLLKRLPTGDVDTEFHGDIRLTSTSENQLLEYVARFTHGTLEWIRPWAEVTEMQRALLTP